MPNSSRTGSWWPLAQLKRRDCEAEEFSDQCELGEKVLFLPRAPDRRGDLSAGFDCWIYLGCMSLDGQAYVGTPSGVIRCRTVRQLSVEEGRDGAEHEKDPVVS